MLPKDTYLHRGLRLKLIESLKQKGISDAGVLVAFEKVPRHFFFEKAFERWAYEDKAFPIGKGQTISHPFTVAFQTQLLSIKKRDKVMEIGTGSGFQAAILASMGARVYTIERHKSLSDKAKSLLQHIGFRGIRFYFKDGYKGLPEFAPFDKIIVTAGAGNIPEALKAQLAIGGKMVIPAGTTDDKEMYLITRLSENQYQEERFGSFKFVPFLKGTEK